MRAAIDPDYLKHLLTTQDASALGQTVEVIDEAVNLRVRFEVLFEAGGQFEDFPGYARA